MAWQRSAVLPGPRTPWAFARDVWDLATDQYDALATFRRRYGTVSAVGVPPLRFTFALGREANEHILATEPDAFSWGEALWRLKVVDGDTALVVTDGDAHRRRRNLVQPAFAVRRIHGYLPIMREEADRTIDGWRAGTTVNAYDDFRVCVRRIVTRALFGDDLSSHADDIGEVLGPAIDFVNRNPARQVHVDLPGTGYRKAVRARERADDIVRAAIARRSTSDAGTLLDALCATGDDGDRLSEQEILDQVISLIAAGYDTTSAAVGWSILETHRQPGVLDRLRDELGDVDDVERLVGLPYLDGIVQETLRLHPPGPASARVTTRPVTIDGVTIRKGRLVVYSGLVTQTDPALWGDVDEFRPERWVDFEPAPYSFVPFGGGSRRCIGHLLATLEIKVITARVAQRTDLTLLARQPRPTGIAAMRPRGGVPVRVGAFT